MKNDKLHILAGRGLILGTLLGGLAACGGSSATTPTVTPSPSTSPTADEMLLAQSALNDQYSPINYTDLSSIQTSGSATYNGYIGGDLSNTADALPDSVIGEMALVVNFNNTSVSVSGSADNFRDGNNGVLTGNLQFSDGALDRDGDPSSDATLTLSADGTLTDASNRAMVFGSRLEGDFLEADSAGVGGNVLGRVSYGGANQDFDGSFIAER